MFFVQFLITLLVILFFILLNKYKITNIIEFKHTIVPDVALLKVYEIKMPLTIEMSDIIAEANIVFLKLVLSCNALAAGKIIRDDASKSPTILMDNTTITAANSIRTKFSKPTLMPETLADSSLNDI